jgi:hypothetical protein
MEWRALARQQEVFFKNCGSDLVVKDSTLESDNFVEN